MTSNRQSSAGRARRRTVRGINHPRVAVTATPAGLARWRDLSATLGRRVRIDGTEGFAEDIGARGELIVDGRPFVAGSVTHL